mgnify:CR=1 FL=1
MIGAKSRYGVVLRSGSTGSDEIDVRRRSRVDRQLHLNHEDLVALERAELRRVVVVDPNLVVLGEIEMEPALVSVSIVLTERLELDRLPSPDP